MLQDLSVIDPTTVKNEIETDKGELLPETGSWIFNNPSVEEKDDGMNLKDLRMAHSTFAMWWADDQSQVLWIRGDPGKGKTMLAISLIDEIKSRLGRQKFPSSDKHTLAYFFCIHTDDRKNHAAYILRSLLWQILREHPSLAKPLRLKYDSEKEDIFSISKTGLQSLLVGLDHTTDNPNFHGYFVIDGLDECSEESRDIFLRYLEKVKTSNEGKRGKIKWLVTVRNEVRLWDGALAISLEENAQHIEKAINQYVSQKVEALALDKAYDDYDPTLRTSVENHLRERAKGTFLWVALACKELERRKVTADNTMTVLENLPPELVPLYKRMLDQVLDNEFPSLATDAINILHAVLAAFRPLTFKELAVAADFPVAERTKERYIKDRVLQCGSFLNIRHATGHISLVHQSAKDYLAPRHCRGPGECALTTMYCQNPEKCRCSRRCLIPTMYPSAENYPSLLQPELYFPIEEARTHTALAKRCIDYLSSNLFSRRSRMRARTGQREPQFAVSIGTFGRFPLAHYAILFWVAHGRKATPGIKKAMEGIARDELFLQEWLKMLKASTPLTKDPLVLWPH
jgi:hypothetical protein